MAGAVRKLMGEICLRSGAGLIYDFSEFSASEALGYSEGSFNICSIVDIRIFVAILKAPIWGAH